MKFAHSSDYDIPASTKGTAIKSIDVSCGVSGGIKPYIFSASGLPNGIIISKDGLISGAPTDVIVAGTAKIIVTDSAGTPASANITIAYGKISSSESSSSSSYSSSTTTTTYTYTITTDAGEGGIIDTAKTVSVKEGKDTIFNIQPNAGYTIADVKVDGKSVGAVSVYEFTNVKANHTISATFKKIEYIITTTAGEGGSFDIEQTVSVAEGGSIEFNINPNSGYAIYEVKVDGESVGAISFGAFKKVTENHTVSATFKKIEDMETVEIPDFTDVQKNAWYYDPILKSSSKGWFKGSSASTFSPDATMNRGMIVTVLCRIEGEPSAKANKFSDVAADKYYTKATS